jgi:small subunit ribosomal protein S6
MSTNRQYELVYVMTPESSDEQIAELHTQIEQIVQRYEGTFDKTENWGRRKLAYEIGHHREGNYVVETISGSGELMKEIDRRLRVLDSVIRHLVVRVDAVIRVADRTRDARKATQARRRTARGLPPGKPTTGRSVASLIRPRSRSTSFWCIRLPPMNRASAPAAVQRSAKAGASRSASLSGSTSTMNPAPLRRRTSRRWS